MKYLATVLICCSAAWPQLTRGSIAVYSSTQDEIVVGADSRAVFGAGLHKDTECKLRRFGNNFFFVSTGASSHQKTATAPAWSTFIEAKNAWKESSRFASMSSAQALTHQTAEGWATVIQNHLNNFEAISTLRPLINGPVIGQAIFGATNDRQELAGSIVNISVDLQLFDSQHIVRLTHTVSDLVLGNGGAIGLPEVVTEYAGQESQRAKEFMGPYLRSLSPENRNAELVKKLIELSVELHPKRAFLGLPVDELALRRGKGTKWLQVKPNCRTIK